jgi:hypothetical protein
VAKNVAQQPDINRFLEEAKATPKMETREEKIARVMEQAKPGIVELTEKGYGPKHIADRINAILPTGHPRVSVKEVRAAAGLSAPVTKTSGAKSGSWPTAGAGATQ